MNAYFAERLRALRRERGWTQSALAARVARSQGVIANWEGARCEPTASAVAALCDALEVSADYLLGRSDERGK